MAESKSSRIFVGVATSICIGVLGWIASFVPSVSKWFFEVISTIFTHLLNNSSVPNWSIYLIVAFCFPSILSVIALLKKPRAPKVTSYNKDTFLGVVWRWTYNYWDNPVNIWAYCPNDDTVLVYEESSDFNHRNTTILLHCETCNRQLLREQGSKDYLIAKVHRQIDRKIRVGEWRNSI